MTAASNRGESDLGRRLRQLRSARGLSVRELARRAGCSASLVSQVERGLTVPSAGVVYALANELAISLDTLFGPEDLRMEDLGPATEPADLHASRPTGAAGRDGSSGGWGRAEGPAGEGILQRADARGTIELSTGVRWERLTPRHDSRVDFLDVVYAPFGSSTEPGAAVRHDGREYLRVLDGELEAVLGFETLRLGTGDSLAFDPMTPHTYRNPTDRTVRTLSVVVHEPAARQATDADISTVAERFGRR